MNRQFFLILLGSLVVVGLVVLGLVGENQKTILQLNGSVTDVQVRPLSDGASLVLVDLEATNPAKIGFEINQIDVEAKMGKDTLPSGLLRKSEAKSFFEYEQIATKNPLIGIGDQIKSGEKAKRMVAARFEVAPAQLEGAEFVVRFTNVNHVVAEVKGRKR